jgi:hypothetical protein
VAAESDFTVVSLLLPERWFRNELPLASRLNIFFISPRKAPAATDGISMFQGVLAVGEICGTQAGRTV